MKIKQIEIFTVNLPFRFAFKHNLASRVSSDNIIVRVIVEHNSNRHIGYGESIPRDYVTGETVDEAIHSISEEYIPNILNRDFANLNTAIEFLFYLHEKLGLRSRSCGSSWCAIELAILDALAKANHISLYDCLRFAEQKKTDGIIYGGVVPFNNMKVLKFILFFYKFYDFKTVKLKVGRDFDYNLRCLSLAREILGEDVILRVDANCAWTQQETIDAARAMRRFRVASIEQPLPAHDIEGMAIVSDTIPEKIIADESLCTIEQAKTLVRERACTGFNIRVSKVGGILAALEIAKIARRNSIACHIGAQVGESGILSAAGRLLAALSGTIENCEGSFNRFLLKKDITYENLTVERHGLGKLLKGYGLGITVKNRPLNKLGKCVFSTDTDKAAKDSRRSA